MLLQKLQMISTSEQPAEHLFAGQNTQQLGKYRMQHKEKARGRNVEYITIHRESLG